MKDQSGQATVDDDCEPFLERRDASNTCWWCGAEATTAEHKFKKSDLRRIKADDEFLYHYEDGDPKLGRINGVNSQRVKFRKNLCAPCNNARSQPFDRAYDKLSNYVDEHIETVADRESLNMFEIYPGQDGDTQILNLAQYFMKYLGCRIDNSGYRVPRQIVRFCDDASFMPQVEIVFFRDAALSLSTRIDRAAGNRVFPLYHSALEAALTTDGERLPTAMYGESIIGGIGVIYGWNSRLPVPARPFYLNRSPTLHVRKDLPFRDAYERWPDYLKAYRT
ncbi:hypothetical protein [Rhodococcus qingshengii]|uniref:hypothetical protein n=1 Tax=Rhodococcus qingshengii TaxID=334542 RepID=UPI001C8B3742|nr:hypothetical protein [Rhodococcus qingshengii]MBX9150082.1 hypothetical protein [Rhodococcus qingshengii]